MRCGEALGITGRLSFFARQQHKPQVLRYTHRPEIIFRSIRSLLLGLLSASLLIGEVSVYRLHDLQEQSPWKTFHTVPHPNVTVWHWSGQLNGK